MGSAEPVNVKSRVAEYRILGGSSSFEELVIGLLASTCCKYPVIVHKHEMC